MLCRAIQMIKFYLWTGFGDLNGIYGSTSKKRPFQGLCQEN